MFKKGIKTEAKNYSPISRLPLLSKVIEKSIYDQKQDYLQRNEQLHSYQSGFRANHSTDTCLIDLQKAFDTLDHKILLDKIKCISFSDKTLKWFHSYLINRVIFVSLGTVFSEAGTIN